MPKKICVVLEVLDSALRKVSLELLSEGRRIADQTQSKLIAVLPGDGIMSLIPTVAAYGADEVIAADDARLKNYTTGSYTSVLSHIIRGLEADAVLLGNTAQGRDLAPRLAQRLGVGMASDCVGMEFNKECFLQFKRPIYAGKIFEFVQTQARPVMATIRPNTFAIAELQAGWKTKVTEISVQIDPADLRSSVWEIARSVSSRPELTDADVIVSGGRALKGTENFKLLAELADVLGGAVGATKAAVEAGYSDVQYQVGQTGKTVAPTLYIACGISGAIQHLAGMRTSKVIVAINKDPDANIFTVADYGIVGDLFEIVPLLTEELKKQLV